MIVANVQILICEYFTIFHIEICLIESKNNYKPQSLPINSYVAKNTKVNFTCGNGTSFINDDNNPIFVKEFTCINIDVVLKFDYLDEDSCKGYSYIFFCLN